MIKIISVEYNEKYDPGYCWGGAEKGKSLVTMEDESGRTFSVYIPNHRWSEEICPIPHGLNLVFGEGRHYE